MIAHCNWPPFARSGGVCSCPRVASGAFHYPFIGHIDPTGQIQSGGARAASGRRPAAGGLAGSTTFAAADGAGPDAWQYYASCRARAFSLASALASTNAPAKMSTDTIRFLFAIAHCLAVPLPS